MYSKRHTATGTKAGQSASAFSFPAYQSLLLPELRFIAL